MVFGGETDIFSGAWREFRDGAGSTAAVGRGGKSYGDGDGDRSFAARSARDGARGDAFWYLDGRRANARAGSSDSARSAEVGRVGDADRTESAGKRCRFDVTTSEDSE